MQHHTTNLQLFCSVFRKVWGYAAKRWAVTKCNLVEPARSIKNIESSNCWQVVRKKKISFTASVTEMFQCVCVRLWWQEKKTQKVMKTNTRGKNVSLCIVQQLWYVSQNMTRRSCRQEVCIIMEQPWSLLQVTAYTSFVCTVLFQSGQTTKLRLQFCASKYTHLLTSLLHTSTEHQINTCVTLSHKLFH